ncbi:MAG: hypothetical protein DDT32_02272 [Syntrophomonadaceae bacterium]|nr:hypothetical protein [Bacillota bacterium]
MYNLKKDEKGIVMVWVAILLPVLLLFSALTLDMGRAMMVAGMFQDALDAAAWAAVVPDASEIFVEPSPTPVGQEPTYVVRLNLVLATSRARAIFADNWSPIPSVALTRLPMTVMLSSPNRAQVTARIEIPTYLVGPLLGPVVVDRKSEAQSIVW